MDFKFFMPVNIKMGRRIVEANQSLFKLGTRALIVTGANSAKASGALDDVTKVLDNLEIPFDVFDKVMQNPTVEICYEGADFGRETKADFIIAIGGGSPIDAAKIIAWLIRQPIERNQFFKTELTDDVLPIIAIPTTAGTGSEVTPYSILTDLRHNTKNNFQSPYQYPKYALIDAEYTKTLSKDVTIDTALDALSHAVEGAYAIGASILTKTLACNVIHAISGQLRRIAADENPDRDKLMYAATIAGMIISQNGTGLVHAMGYPLTVYRNIPHGRANGLLLAGYIQFQMPHLAKISTEMLAAGGWEDVDELAGLIETLIPEKNCPTEEELHDYAEMSLKLSMMKRYSVPPSREDVIDIYRQSF